MNLYRVYNGFYANSAVAVLVIAETGEAAIERTRPVFQCANPFRPEFSERLEVEAIFFDTSVPQCSEVIECSEVTWGRE